MTDSYTVIPLSPLRKVIAARMTETKQTIPHFRLTVDIELDALLAARADANSRQLESKISINDCLVKACGIALASHPAVNIQLVGEEIRQFREVDISVAVAVDGGLVTPVVRNVGGKTVREIAVQMRSLASRAAARQLKMSEIMGGSFSLSNLGAYGIDQFDAIINAPQGAILAVGRAKPQLVPADEGGSRAVMMMHATLSADHRAIDGASGAGFLQTLRQTLESPHGIFDDDRAAIGS